MREYINENRIMMDTKRLSEMSDEELWALFPIVLKEYNADYPL